MRQVRFKGQPVTLLGQQVNHGDIAPQFRAKTINFETVDFPGFLNASRILLFTVPSLDTPVCHNETCYVRDNFLGWGMPVVVCSKDLPFAQARWAKEFLKSGQNLTLLSDFPYNECGRNYGIETELGLLARAVFLIDKNKISYIQIVEEITEEPSYEPLLSYLNQL